jgi:hypothetical protein
MREPAVFQNQTRQLALQPMNNAYRAVNGHPFAKKSRVVVICCNQDCRNTMYMRNAQACFIFLLVTFDGWCVVGGTYVKVGKPSNILPKHKGWVSKNTKDAYRAN